MRSLDYSIAGMLVLALGCGSEVSMQEYADAGQVDATPPVDTLFVDAQPAVDPNGTNFLYVVNTIDVPTTAAEATALGLDIDFDGNNTVDNKLGQVLAALATNGSNDPQVFIDARIADGTILQLVNIKATALNDALRVGFSLYVGEDGDNPDNPADNFSGYEEFNIAPGSPTDSLLAGGITVGHLSAWDGNMPLLITIADNVDPIQLNLVGARVEADPTGTNIINGHLAGGIREQQIIADIYPALEQTFDNTVAADCTGTTCVSGSDGENLLNMFDTNGDGDITLAELENSTFLNSLFAPDMDLFDAEGFYNPNDDGVLDTLSFGVGFTAVGALFVPPFGQ